jgi:hypothetical protein
VWYFYTCVLWNHPVIQTLLVKINTSTALHLPVCKNLAPYRDSIRGPSSPYLVAIPTELPVQTGPGAHPASCTMGTGSFLGVERPGRGADHPSSAEVENK